MPQLRRVRRHRLSAKAKAPASPKPTAKSANAPTASDGQFEFKVLAMTCGLKSVGVDFLASKAQGQFCVIKMQVTNTGTDAQTLFDTNQYVYDAAGRKYEADLSAGISANSSDSQVWIAPINPGNSVTGVMVYDMPKGDKPASIEVHDSAFSGGATIQLG